MEELPEGLLSTTKTLPSSFDDSMPVHVQDITLLWKAYNVKPSALEGIIGYRLANFFWRIWSNDCLRISLPGATVAKLFMRISGSTASKVSEVPSNTNPSLRKNKSEGKLPERLNNRAAHRGPLQSILKKPNAAPKETHKTARWLITDDTDNSSTCEAVNSATPTTASASATDVPTSHHSHKKTQFVASKTAKGSKRRPVILRRKSSQSTSGVKSTRTQSPQRGAFTKRAEKAEGYVEPEVLLPEREVTRSPSPELREAIPLPKHFEEIMPGEQPELPPSFLTNLKLLLKLRPRTASYKTAPLTMGFRSQIPNKFRDIRYLYIEYYRLPPRAIVHAEFRALFLKRMWEEQVFLASFLEKKKLQQQQESFGSEGTSLSTTFESSIFSNSNGNDSTAPTSVDVSMTSEYNANAAESNGSVLNGAGEIPRSFFHYTPSPLKRLESLLGMEIEECRRNGTLVYEEIDPEEENLGPVKLPRCYYDTLSEWDYHD
ncbi:hypothetical protein IFM60648_07850 [Aspergillus lentulus]|uniref:Nitrogen regulatory protein areA GATA-like domain-containing protein n=1 Tax=Aspergillus lentulus TaxID=293939 RepID=A0ABQ1AS41_ASPLE|nr:hypothetical protein IFM60648_07850 [Aspergillus lentulus]